MQHYYLPIFRVQVACCESNSILIALIARDWQTSLTKARDEETEAIFQNMSTDFPCHLWGFHCFRTEEINCFQGNILILPIKIRTKWMSALQATFCPHVPTLTKSKSKVVPQAPKNVFLMFSTFVLCSIRWTKSRIRSALTAEDCVGQFPLSVRPFLDTRVATWLTDCVANFDRIARRRDNDGRGRQGALSGSFLLRVSLIKPRTWAPWRVKKGWT